MAEKNNKKQVQNILKDLNKTGKRLESVFGLMESAMAATTDAAKASNKIVNDKFKTLTNTLKLQKESNGYYKAANDVTKKLSDNSKKLTKSEKEQLELHRKQLRVMGKIDDVASDITEQFGMQASAIKNGVKQARLLLNPIVALSGVLALSVKRFFDLEKLGKGTARESGLLAMNTTDFANKIEDVQPDLIAFGASIDDISKASAAVADNFGVLTSETADIVSESVKVGAAFGVQADTMVNVVSEARLLGASMKDISMFTDDVINSGVQVNKVFEDLKAVQGDTALILAGQTNQLMSQVLEARKLGLNLNDIANSTSATGSFQDMFTSQMKASVLFGRSINLVESTRLRRQGKFLEARRRELTSLTGTTDLAQQALRIEGMSVEQKKELERITGRTASDTIKDLNRQLLLQGKLTGDAKRIAESELKREQLLQRQLNLQDKLSAIFSRLSIKIGEQLLPVITTFGNYLENLLDEPGKLNEILDTTVGYLKTAFKTLILIKGISFAGSVASLFGGVGGGAGAPMLQNLFSGTDGRGSKLGGRKRTMGGALNKSASRMNMIGSGAKFLRVLGPAAAAISVGADVFKLATTKDAKERKKALGGTIGGALGGGLGLFLGGPAGAAVGAGLGQFAGKAVSKYFETEEEELSRAARSATANISREIALSVRGRKNEITSSLAGALKDINYDQVADKISSSLKIDDKSAQALLDQSGMTADSFAKLDDKGLKTFVKSLVAASGVVDKYSANLKTLADQAASEAGIEEAKQVVSFVQGIKKDLGGDTEDSQKMLVEAFIKSQDEHLLNVLKKRDDFNTMSADKLMNFFETSMEKGAFKGQHGLKNEELMIQQGQDFFKELLTQQLGADTFKELAGGDTDKFIKENVTGYAMRGLQAFGDYEEEHLGETATSLIDLLLKQAMMEQNRKSVEARKIYQQKKAGQENTNVNYVGGGDAMTTPIPIQNDFTLRSNPADTLMVQGGTQIGNDVIEKLNEVITAIEKSGGDIIMDGKKVGRQIARSQS